MIKQSALLAALALATGCAHHTSENRVVISERSSPYVAGSTYRSESAGGATTTYGSSYGTAIYGPGWNEDYDNTSKGAGARALMANPYAENATTYYSSGPAGAPVAVGTESEESTSKGAGARELTEDSRATETTTGTVVATTPGTTTETDLNSQGEGARVLSGNEDATITFKDDATFVRDAAQSGLAEVRMGELAQQNAQDQALKDFGRRLVEDHQKANSELMSIAQQKGMQTPTSMSQREQGMIDRLSSLNGPEFDKDCGRDAIRAHERAVRLFRMEAQSGKDADLKAFAQKTLPILEEHLKMARDLNKSARHE